MEVEKYGVGKTLLSLSEHIYVTYIYCVGVSLDAEPMLNDQSAAHAHH